MKKILKLALSMAAASLMFIIKSDGGAIARSYFVVRPVFQSVMPERESFFRNDRMTEREDGYDGTFEAVVFGGKSTNPQKMTQYFLPWEKCSLTFLEYDSAINPEEGQCSNNNDVLNRDTFTIDASHFNIVTNEHNFKSTVTFKPEQSYVGAGFAWKQLLSRKCDGTPGFWLEASMPVVHVRNTMGMCERITSTGGGADTTIIGLDGATPVGSVTEAFKQSTWLFGKIDKCSSCMEATGVAEIEVKIGYNTINSERVSLNSYIGVVIPTSNKAKSRYLFEPIYGNGCHAGFQFGLNAGFDVWSCDQHTISFQLATNSRYLFANHQVRSLDLQDKQWSRYMAMYSNLDAANTANTDNAVDTGTSGINLMTKCVQVTPRFWFNMNSAMVYTNSDCPWMAEIGWNFFGRQAEKVCVSKWVQDPALKGYAGNGDTTLARTIKYQFYGSNLPNTATNYAATEIQKSDINPESAAAPAALSYIMYGTVGYNWGTKCYPTFAGIGGSYEFTQNNAALERWMLWGKLGFSY